jgi:hypothetical protein
VDSTFSGKDCPVPNRSGFTATLSSPLKAIESLLSGRGVSVVFLNDWKNSFHAWIELFQEAARYHDTFVCPGSIFLPDLDWEAATG